MTMNTCHSFLEAMKFKGLPFHFLVRLKYKEKKGGGWMGGKLRQQIVTKTQRRWERGGERTGKRVLEAFSGNLNF